MNKGGQTTSRIYGVSQKKVGTHFRAADTEYGKMLYSFYALGYSPRLGYIALTWNQSLNSASLLRGYMRLWRGHTRGYLFEVFFDEAFYLKARQMRLNI